MDPIVSYLLRSVISGGILTAYYWFVLRNRKFHHYNRFYLLSAIMIGLFVPFLNFRLFNVDQPHYEPVNGLLSIISPDAPVDKPVFQFSWLWVLFTGSALVSAVLLLNLLLKIGRIYRLRRQYAPVKMKGYYFIETDLEQAPFSFFNNLFWRKDISLEDPDGKNIFKHELTHIRERHTYDKLFSQIIVCIFWMNPFYWIIQRELNLIHEFIADEKSIHEGDTVSFAHMMLQAHNEGRYLDPSHMFFNSSIKRRLIMITTSKKTTLSYLRRIMVLPVTLLVFVLFSFSIARAQNKPSKPDSTVTRSQKEDEERRAYEKSQTPAAREAAEKRQKELVKHRVEVIQKNPPAALYFINGRESSMEDIQKLDPEKVKRVYSLYIGAGKFEDEEHAKSPWGREMAAKYGEKIKSGIVDFITE